MTDNSKHSEITEQIIKAFYTVYNQLGYGFLERVYENALVIELRKAELECDAQVPIDVYYDNTKGGVYFADLIVNGCVIVEVKACESLCDQHEAQLINYLKATDIEVGMLLNFGNKPSFKRKVYSMEYKNLKKS